MRILTETVEISTKGGTDIVDVTPQAVHLLERSGLNEGSLTVFIPGSTAGVTSIEYEPGLIRDLPEILEKVAPENGRYHHDDTWGDGNGHAHVRAAMIGASFTVPFKGKKLLLGTWQQIVVMDFDNRPRKRSVVFQLTGD